MKILYFILRFFLFYLFFRFFIRAILFTLAIFLKHKLKAEAIINTKNSSNHGESWDKSDTIDAEFKEVK